MSVVGARPQFTKLAPMDQAFKAAGIEHIIVHTGQHYDPALSEVFFRDLGISAPDVHLNVGSGSHGRQTGAMLAALDEVLETHPTDWVLVYGDTNSTLAAALAAVKMHIPLAHLEAGLRSFNRLMPEEHNRILTDHAADLLLAPTQVARQHLEREGLASRTVVVGDVMTDVLYQVKKKVAGDFPALANQLGLTAQEFSLATIHRAENTDNPAHLGEIIETLRQVDHPVLLLAHPRLVAKTKAAGISLVGGNLRTLDPFSYPQLVALAMHARGIITDSGGLQKEAFLLRVPCTTVREQTEWVETVELGWNVLVKPGIQLLKAATRPYPAPTDATPYGDGHAAAQVVNALQNFPS